MAARPDASADVVILDAFPRGPGTRGMTSVSSCRCCVARVVGIAGRRRDVNQQRGRASDGLRATSGWIPLWRPGFEVVLIV